VLLGRRKKYRPLKKFRAAANVEEHEITNVQGASSGTAERQKRRELLGIAVKLSRRPIPEQQDGYDDLVIVRRIRDMKPTKIVRMIRVINVTMDGSPKAIAMQNIKQILKGRNVLVMATVNIKSGIFMVRVTRKQLQSAMKKWAIRWGRKQVAVCITVRMVAKSSRSILQILDNSEECARQPKEDMA
jgi:hypothetical protein